MADDAAKWREAIARREAAPVVRVSGCHGQFREEVNGWYTLCPDTLDGAPYYRKAAGTRAGDVWLYRRPADSRWYCNGTAAKDARRADGFMWSCEAPAGMLPTECWHWEVWRGEVDGLTVEAVSTDHLAWLKAFAMLEKRPIVRFSGAQGPCEHEVNGFFDMRLGPSWEAPLFMMTAPANGNSGLTLWWHPADHKWRISTVSDRDSRATGGYAISGVAAPGVLPSDVGDWIVSDGRGGYQPQPSLRVRLLAKNEKQGLYQEAEAWQRTHDALVAKPVVRFSGAKGPSKGLFNGWYELQPGPDDEAPVYRKAAGEQAGQLFLHWTQDDGAWWVSTPQAAESRLSEGRIRSAAVTAGTLPAEACGWEVIGEQGEELTVIAMHAVADPKMSSACEAGDFDTAFSLVSQAHQVAVGRPEDALAMHSYLCALEELLRSFPPSKLGPKVREWSVSLMRQLPALHDQVNRMAALAALRELPREDLVESAVDLPSFLGLFAIFRPEELRDKEVRVGLNLDEDQVHAAIDASWFSFADKEATRDRVDALNRAGPYNALAFLTSTLLPLVDFALLALQLAQYHQQQQGLFAALIVVGLVFNAFATATQELAFGGASGCGLALLDLLTAGLGGFAVECCRCCYSGVRSEKLVRYCLSGSVTSLGSLAAAAAWLLKHGLVVSNLKPKQGEIAVRLGAVCTSLLALALAGFEANKQAFLREVPLRHLRRKMRSASVLCGLLVFHLFEVSASLVLVPFVTVAGAAGFFILLGLQQVIFSVATIGPLLVERLHRLDSGQPTARQIREALVASSQHAPFVALHALPLHVLNVNVGMAGAARDDIQWWLGRAAVVARLATLTGAWLRLAAQVLAPHDAEGSAFGARVSHVLREEFAAPPVLVFLAVAYCGFLAMCVQQWLSGRWNTAEDLPGFSRASYQRLTDDGVMQS